MENCFWFKEIKAIDGACRDEVKGHARVNSKDDCSQQFREKSVMESEPVPGSIQAT